MRKGCCALPRLNSSTKTAVSGWRKSRRPKAELSRLLTAAAKGGDAKAIALRVETDMWAAYRMSGGVTEANENGPGLPALTDARLNP